MPSIWKLASAIDHSLAKPTSAVRLGRAQLAHRDAEEGVPHLHALVAIDPGLAPEADELTLWPSLVRESAIRHVLDMPGGRRRIEAMLGLARFLPQANRDEALAGILDGTAP